MCFVPFCKIVRDVAVAFLHLGSGYVSYGILEHAIEIIQTDSTTRH